MRWWGALLLVLAACESTPHDATRGPIAADRVASQAARVSYLDGCFALLDTRPLRCIRKPGARVRLWIEAGDATSLELRRDGETLPIDGTGAHALAIDPEADHESIELWSEGSLVFALELEPIPARLIEAEATLWSALDGSSYAALARALAEARTRERGLEAQWLECMMARFAMELGDRKGVLDGPARLGAGEGPHNRQCLATLHIQAASFARKHDADFELARRHLEAVAALPELVDANLEADYELANLDYELGHVVAAAHAFEAIAEQARSLELHDSAAQADIMAALALADLGRFEHARESADRAIRAPVSSADFARELRQNAAWLQIVARWDRPWLPDPAPQLRALIAEFEAEGSHEASERANDVRIDLAIAAEQSGDGEQLRSTLATIDRRGLDLRGHALVELLEAELARGDRHFDAARAHLERATDHARARFDLELELRVELVRAELEYDAGELERSRAAFASADALADRIAVGVSPPEGRSFLAAKLRRARSKQLELLLELGDARAALCMILEARAETIQTLASSWQPASAHDEPGRLARLSEFERGRRALAERSENAWQLPRHEREALQRTLPLERARLAALLEHALAARSHASAPWTCERALARRPGHALTTMHRALDGGWYFVVLSDHMAWVYTPIREPEAAADDALARLVAAGAFDDATQLAIAPVDEMNGVELDRLAPVEQLGLPVVYELGLARTARPFEPRADAVVLAGASGLRRARSEADEVASRLEHGGWRVEPTWTPNAEQQPILLHFAGHGLHTGLAGWASSLTLDERELSSTELLAIGHAPELVVLGACEAAARVPDAIDGGMNMATAFLLAGAELVIAPDQPVDDRVSEAFALALHREPLPTGPGRREALLAALWRVRREDPRFAVWRAWVP